MPVRLVIFDCDGVLIDSEPVANRVLARQLRGIGVFLSEPEVMRRFVGKTRDECLVLASKLAGRNLPAGFGEEWDAALFEAMRTEVRAVDGVPEVLARLKIPYCVASNGMPERMRVALGAAGLLRYFEGRIFSSVDVARPKPAPDLFLHAAKSMNAPPSACAVIEDTVIGVRAARAAGMRVFGYVGSGTSSAATLRAEGAHAFDDMRELPELLA